MKPSKLLLVTPGDPDGIGPEVVWKGIRENFEKWKGTPLLCVGARKPFKKLRAPVVEASPGALNPPRRSDPYVWLLPAPEKAPVGFLPGFQAGWSIQTAARMALSGDGAALVTGPIHKERLQRGSFFYNGHTDFLADLCRAGEITMMLANSQLRVSLVTTHCALQDVPKKITKRAVARAIDQTFTALSTWWGIRKPRIAVCGLNPHSGEGGLFGNEERKVIVPAISAARRRYLARAEISGPHPSDTLFAKHHAAQGRDRYDAVVCMYHDQGLIPVKLLDFPRTVNLTLGLPILRTSVDHGTAFDIAGKNRADPSSFISAVDTARLFMKTKGIRNA